MGFFFKSSFKVVWRNFCSVLHDCFYLAFGLFSLQSSVQAASSHVVGTVAFCLVWVIILFEFLGFFEEVFFVCFEGIKRKAFTLSAVQICRFSSNLVVQSMQS